MILRFLISLPVWFIGTMILPWPLVPIAVRFSDKYGRLPWVFRWLETHDNVGWNGPLSEAATAQFSDNPHKMLRRWLWRNKAYRLRYWLGIDYTDNTELNELRTVPRKIINRKLSEGDWGFGLVYICVYDLVSGKFYFEFQPQIGLGKLKLYFRIGWKLKRIADGKSPKGSTGMYTGITPRTDDYDD